MEATTAGLRFYRKTVWPHGYDRKWPQLVAARAMAAELQVEIMDRGPESFSSPDGFCHTARSRIKGATAGTRAKKGIDRRCAVGLRVYLLRGRLILTAGPLGYLSSWRIGNPSGTGLYRLF